MQLEEVIEANKRKAAELRRENAKRMEEEERSTCIECGEPIKEWEEINFEGDEVVLTYTCKECGAHAAQHFSIDYERTEVYTK
jgi:hypothetical protein